MSGGEAAEAPEQEKAEAVEEPKQMSERTAKAILLVVVGLAAWGILVAAPWLAYVVVGLLLDRGWLKVQAWRERRAEQADSEMPTAGQERADADVVSLLQQLGRSMLLTELRDDLGLPDTKVVKALLDEAGIPWKPVRTDAGNGPGVHKGDIPAVLSPAADSPRDRCFCRSGDNGNAGNVGSEGAEEGLRVVPIGTDGKIVYDPKDTIRHHQVK